MTVRAALIGDPVDHSLSPVMHNAAFQALGIDAVYELWHTPLADLPQRVDSVRGEDILGANVTVPHKQDVFDLVDAATDTAQRIGAVNTILPVGNGLLGDNTDAYGFATSLREEIATLPDGLVLVIGAGGASRAVLVALEEMGFEAIALANRTRSRAEDLIDALRLRNTRVIDLAEIPATMPDAGLVINATSIGWHEDLSPVSPDHLALTRHAAVAVDLTYRDTPFLQAARAAGYQGIDGLGMLIHQGARSFALWTGQEPPVEVMRQAVIAEQQRRAADPR